MIRASAPIRICDNGGWTDTWFGSPGKVLNIAVSPRIEVEIRATDTTDAVLLNVTSFGDRYTVVPGAARGNGRHRLLEAAIDALTPPPGCGLEITVSAAVPPGCGTGTSASVAVALLGALAAARPESMTPREVAYAAHRLEVDVLGVQSGIQDQLSAAYGGINFLEIEPYPEAAVHTLPPWDDLGARLSLVYLGRAHDSPAVHDWVIDDARRHGSDVFSHLRAAAVAARDAVVSRDLTAFGRATIANTDAQRALHPALVGTDATAAIELASALGAIGWKVNGAGGEGGSVTIVSASPHARAEFEGSVGALDPAYRVIPIEMSPIGLRVEGSLSPVAPS